MAGDSRGNGIRRTRDVRVRLWWTALLVLIALGGAGLAVAADRPHNPAHRPELTWHADEAAQPWIAALIEDLTALDEQVSAISSAGRGVLGTLQALDLQTLDRALADGDAAAAAMDGALDELVGLRDRAGEQIDEWRLGPETGEALARANAAVDAAATVPATWLGMADDAREVAAMVDALLRHDGLVFRATTAGRQSQWDDALDFLSQAAAPLAEVEGIRDGLGGDVDPATLDDLLSRYRGYDEALTDLYTYIRDTGEQGGAEFEALRERMEEAQAALPADTSALSVIVAEAAGPPLTRALVAIEGAHGDINDAIATDEETDGATDELTDEPVTEETAAP